MAFDNYPCENIILIQTSNYELAWKDLKNDLSLGDIDFLTGHSRENSYQHVLDKMNQYEKARGIE